MNNAADNNEDLVFLIKRLTGIQKIIFNYVIQLCAARRVLDTGNILSSDLALTASCSIPSIKTSLIRLIEKKLVTRLRGKSSKGGYIVLGITKDIQAANVQAQFAFFNPLKPLVKGNDLDNASSYNSSSNKKNTTTVLPAEWKKINFESLLHIGFTTSHLYQLWSCNKTDPENVQGSINKFAYSLEHNQKTKSYPDPLNILIGVLRKGNSWNEMGYEKNVVLPQALEEHERMKKEWPVDLLD